MSLHSTDRKIRWGILGTARVATNRVLPGMRQCHLAEAVAIASRSLEKSRAAAEMSGIARAFGSYEELLADPEVEAVYIPLPNHLHVPWSIKAARAGKHVLCEKPIGLSAAEVDELIRVRDETGSKIGEAFMVRTHPRWLRVRELVRSGRIGRLRAISGYFTFPLGDVKNVRYAAEWGGGALMDIGCYQIHLSRMLFEEEPRRVAAVIDAHREKRVDLLTSMLLEFPSGHGSFTCGFEVGFAQRMTLLGTRGRIDVDLPVAAPDSRPTCIQIDDGSGPFGAGTETEEFPACNQYAIHIDTFSRAILDNLAAPLALEDSRANMRAIQAAFRSSRSGLRESPAVAP
jgi:predicted dehydrogenase